MPVRLMIPEGWNRKREVVDKNKKPVISNRPNTYGGQERVYDIENTVNRQWDMFAKQYKEQWGYTGMVKNPAVHTELGFAGTFENSPLGRYLAGIELAWKAQARQKGLMNTYITPPELPFVKSPPANDLEGKARRQAEILGEVAQDPVAYEVRYAGKQTPQTQPWMAPGGYTSLIPDATGVTPAYKTYLSDQAGTTQPAYTMPPANSPSFAAYANSLNAQPQWNPPYVSGAKSPYVSGQLGSVAKAPPQSEARVWQDSGNVLWADNPYL